MKHQQVSEDLAGPPGLALPPGLSAPSGSARKKAAKRLADLELAAAGYPPGLSPPPGLETIDEDVAHSDSTTVDGNSTEFTESPAGARESAWDDSEMYQVQLSGLPNEILSDIMFKAVLQQAQLNGSYSSFSTSPGKACGTAVVNLISASAAEWAVVHFHGRVWADDRCVTAYLVPKIQSEEEAWFQSCADMEFDGISFQSFVAEVEVPSTGFSADSPAFVPSQATPNAMSAEAAVFVPGQKSMALDQKFANGSDVSTSVDGESESDEEKVAVEVVAA